MTDIGKQLRTKTPAVASLQKKHDCITILLSLPLFVYSCIASVGLYLSPFKIKRFLAITLGRSWGNSGITSNRRCENVSRNSYVSGHLLEI